MSDLENFVKGYVEEFKGLISQFPHKEVENAISLIHKAYRANNQVFVAGNGGSASTASHIACDLGKGILSNPHDNLEKRLRVISLTDNVPIMTAYANDISYDEIFSQQLKNLLKEDDVLIAISASGNSLNVVHAAEYAKSKGAKVIGMTGFEGGKLMSLSDCKVHIPIKDYGKTEDLHLMVNHLITAYLRNFKDKI